jgi:hypothetical protein
MTTRLIPFVLIAGACLAWARPSSAQTVQYCWFSSTDTFSCDCRPKANTGNPQVADFTTNGVYVYHDQSSESVFSGHSPTLNQIGTCLPQQPQGTDINYFPQVVKVTDSFYQVLNHTGPRGKNTQVGDSLKAGTANSYRLPEYRPWILWGNQADANSLLYSTDGPPFVSSGGGNPMVINGPDGYKHIFFFTVAPTQFDPTLSTSTSHSSQSPANEIMYLSEARTTDFSLFQLRSRSGWTDYNDTNCPQSAVSDSCRPALLYDTNNAIIKSTSGDPGDEMVLGSLVYIAPAIYYFYPQCATLGTYPDTGGPRCASYDLVYRLGTTETGSIVWSAPRFLAHGVESAQVGKTIVPGDPEGAYRLLIMYSCFTQRPGQSHANTVDQCLQYTPPITQTNGLDDATITAPLAALTYSTAYALNIAGSYGITAVAGQATLLKDANGQLQTPDNDPCHGGEFFVFDTAAVVPPESGGWVGTFFIVDAPVYRGGWDICAGTRSRMVPNQKLQTNYVLASVDNRYQLWYQMDGNLVLYDTSTSPWTVKWAPGTAESVWNPGRAEMQSDGNFVVYNGSGDVRFSTATYGYSGAHLFLQTDGNLVVYSTSWQPLWSTYFGNMIGR